MDIKRLEHIGIAVNNEAKARELFEKLLGKPVYKTETVESERVRTHFIRIGETKVELLGATDESSPIHKFISKRGEGIHHLAFEVPDIHKAFEEAKAMGLELLNDHPKEGADNKLIFFIHPKSTGGVLVEFCQERS